MGGGGFVSVWCECCVGLCFVVFLLRFWWAVYILPHFKGGYHEGEREQGMGCVGKRRHRLGNG